jgi:hypothetical protein
MTFLELAMFRFLFYFERAGVDVMIIIFGDFCQFSAKKLAFYSKTQSYDNFFQKLAVV